MIVNAEKLLGSKFLENLFEKWYEEQKKTTLIIFIMGQSGVGKSTIMLKLMYLFEKFSQKKEDRKEFNFDINQQIIYTPVEYGKKIENWIKSNYYTIGIDEARFLVSARTWQNFLNRIITEVNATIRQIKYENCNNCGIIFINSQDIKDVDKALRKTVKYLIYTYIDSEGYRRIKIYETFYNLTDDKLYIKKLTISTCDLIIQAKTKVLLFEDNELLKKYHKNIVEAKSQILRKKFEKLEHALKQELGETFNKNILRNDEVFNMIKNMASFSEKRGVYFTREKQEIIMRMFNLTKKEFKEIFYKAFLDELKQRNLI